MAVLNVARVGQTHTKSSAVSSSDVEDAQTCPVIREIKILSYFWGRLIRYLVVLNVGCLIQNWNYLELLSEIQCLECDSMTHFLFISRTDEADSGTQGSGPQKQESEPILASLFMIESKLLVIEKSFFIKIF
jgi:hypothetical protein